MGLEEVLSNLERKDMSFLWKRRLTVIAFCIRMFLVGVEYSIILPSVWLYLKTFKVETWFLGVVVAVYSVAAMISLPLVGRVFDKTRRTKEILFITNLFELVGSLLYALPFSPWFILIGRFIAGCGDGFFSAASGEITHIFPASKRTGIFALLELGRVLGITLGPALNFFLEDVDFYIGKWHIFYGPAPGLFMVMIWILMQFITMFMVFDLSKYEVGDFEEFEEIKMDTKKEPAEEEKYHIETKIDDQSDKGTIVNDDDKKPLLSPKSKSYSDPTEDSKDVTLADSLMELCSLEILAIFYTDLILWLAQTEFEVLAPLVTQEDFKWKEAYLSIIYMVGGVELIFIFLAIWFLGSRVNISDTFLLLFSLCLTTCALLLLIVYQAKRSNHSASVAIFIGVCFLVFFSVPLNLVASKSLLTKITSDESQGFTQGAYSSISRIALILGPILGSSAFHNLALFGALMALLNVIAFVWLVLCLNRIKARIQKKGS